MQTKFVFLTNDEKNKKVKLYFQDTEGGDVLEVSWSNEDYINQKLNEFNAKSVSDLKKVLADNPDVEVYKYGYKDKEGNQHEGFTLDKPFPAASAPDKSIVAGKVLDVRDNGLKVAVTVDVKGEPFTVIRSYYAFDEDTKKSYPLEFKRKNLLRNFGVEDFGDLAGTNITFIRQKAGKNFYYEAEEN